MPLIRREHLKTLQRVRQEVARAIAAQGLNQREHAVLERMVVGPLVNEIVRYSVRHVLVGRLGNILERPQKAVRSVSLGRTRRIVITVKCHNTRAVKNAGRSTPVASPR